jgi:hypothetical protein
MAVVKEFKLHSLIRSQQREDFEKRVKEKETGESKKRNPRT